jgi:heme/copper-type cytochrome/quinol oxidase subunit 4/cytochrome c2
MSNAGGERPDTTGQHTSGSVGMYVGIGALSIVLTIIAFYLVAQSVLLKPYLVPILLVMAAIQVALQTILYMHLNVGRPVYAMFFGFGVAIATVVAGGVFVVVQASTAPPPTIVAAPTQPTVISPTTTPKTPSTPAPPAKPLSQAQLISLGQTILTQKCEACHKLNGAGGTIGPDLNLVMAGKVNLVPGGQPTTASWLKKWIANPQAVWPQAAMPNLELTPQQVDAVVTYLTTQVK